MLQAPTLLEAMTPFPFFLEAQAELSAARAMFEAHNIRHLPIKDEGRAVGVLTPRDLILAGRMSPLPRVGEVCDREVLMVDIHLGLAAVLQTMVDQRVDCALVLKHDQLVGIFTTTDACRQLSQLIASSDPDPIVA